MELPPSPQALEVQSLATLARQFADRRLFEEAVQLFELALRLEPDNRGLRLSLAQVRRLHREQSSGNSRAGLRDVLREQLRRNALDAKHFVGVAHLFFEQGEDERAMEYLEIAIAKDLANPSPHKLIGRIHMRRREWAEAAAHLVRARTFNPFDRRTSELLARSRFELGDFAGALAALVDAVLLQPEGVRTEGDSELKRQIQHIKKSLHWGNPELVEFFRQRQEELKLSFDRLEWHRMRFREGAALDAEAAENVIDTQPIQRQRVGRLELAIRLRRLPAWSHLTDEQVFQLTEIAREEVREPGTLIFAADVVDYDLWLLESGEVTISRDSSYGPIPLGLIKPGELFGEMAFITRLPRSADAFAAKHSRLLCFDGRALTRLVQDAPEIGVQLYWSFWHGLSFKLRCTNEQLKTFFSEEGISENLARLRRGEVDAGVDEDVGLDTKVLLLREQGLSSEELMALATFSQERTYSSGSWIFREGDEGREMFVVLEGKVRISKFIPGGGEEALAILARGDFFGEMALIDHKPRSADARAHEGKATVVALHQDTIREILSMDTRASLEFLELLSRLIAKRLREIDDKLVGWRIMSGIGIGPGDDG